MDEQKKLQGSIKKWLESEGIRVLDDSEKFSINIKDVFPKQNRIHPDLIGIMGNDKVVVVEIETDLEKILEIMGKCMLWRTTATYVYIAYPKDKCQKFRVLEKFGIGLLAISEEKVEEIIGIFSEKNSSRVHNIGELHPTDAKKEIRLYDQIKDMLE